MSSDLVVLVSVNFHWLSGPQFSLDGVVRQPVCVLIPGFEMRNMSFLKYTKAITERLSDVR